MMKKLLMMAVAAVAASVAFADGGGTPTAQIKSITNRYPWNGKIDVEYELSNLRSAFGPIAFATKFTSGDVEVAKTTDLSDAELAAISASASTRPPILSRHGDIDRLRFLGLRLYDSPVRRREGGAVELSR